MKTSVSISLAKESIDISDIDSTNTTDTRKRTLGLFDGTVTMSGIYNDADTGQAGLQADFLAGAGAKEVEVIPDGTNGLEFSGQIESFEVSQDASGVAQISVTIVADGTDAPSTA